MRLGRQFFWGGADDRKKTVWVKWEKINVGGLAIKDILVFNKTLFKKWKWRLGLEEKGLCKEIIESKYGS